MGSENKDPRLDALMADEEAAFLTEPVPVEHGRLANVAQLSHVLARTPIRHLLQPWN